jgi:hypothetical protein
MEEPPRMRSLLDVNDIRVRPHYIMYVTTVRANMLTLELEYDDRQLKPRIFCYIDSRRGSLDRPLRYNGECPTIALQRPLAQPQVRGSG